MKRYLYSVTGLIIFYGLFFLGANYQIGEEKIIEFQPFFSIFIVLLPLSLLFVPFVKRYFTIISLALGFGVYALLTLLNQPGAYLTDKGSILTLIIEGFCLLTVLLLIIDIAHQNQLLENLIQSFITPPTQHKLLNIVDDQSQIDNEFYRGRRFGYPVSTMVLSFGDEVDKLENSIPFQLLMNDLQQWIKHRYMYFRFTKIMGKLIRKSDMIVQMEDIHKLLLICPDTPADNLPVLATKIQRKFKESLGIDVACGAASFPDDGSTFRALMLKADESLVNSFQTTKY
jgi:hypothetical protein